jgi:tripartite-type tricarboxylate transporter receptor subunit TctC
MLNTLIIKTVQNLSLALGLTILVAGSPANAQGNFPNKPIRLIVPFTPGGVTDTSGRLIAEQLSKRIGQQVIVENKPGATGNIGSALVANSEPDGYTLVYGFDGTMVVNPHIAANMPFDPIKDFTPIGKIGETVLILVSYPKFEAQTLKEIIALSKQPGKTVTFGSSGIGSPQHVGIELLNQKTGAKLVHVPYKGGGQAMIDVQGGNIPLVFTAVAGAYPHIQSGRIKAVAVSSEKRAPSLPDVPTFIESGVPDFVVSGWVAMFAPAKTPKAVVTYLNKELNAVLNTPDVIARLETMGITPTPWTPEKFAAEVKADYERYGKVIKDAGIKAN